MILCTSCGNDCEGETHEDRTLLLELTNCCNSDWEELSDFKLIDFFQDKLVDKDHEIMICGCHMNDLHEKIYTLRKMIEDYLKKSKDSYFEKHTDKMYERIWIIEDILQRFEDIENES